MSELPKIVQELRGHVKLTKVYLVRGNFEFHSVKPEEPPKRLAIEVRTMGRESPDRPQVLQAVVGVDVKLRAEGSERDVAVVSCEYALDYTLDDPGVLKKMTDDDFENFASLNGVYNAWPYLREFVSSVSGRMPLPRPMLLPTLMPNMLGTPEDRARTGEYVEPAALRG